MQKVKKIVDELLQSVKNKKASLSTTFKCLFVNISVIITTYNRPHLFKRALNAVKRQSYLPNEIIVVEDASNFEIEKWIDDDFPEVTKKNNKNLVLGENWNVATENIQPMNNNLNFL